jgi:beta-lactamase superfamily II metal-dependent hydrolase
VSPALFVLDVGHGNCSIVALDDEAIVVDAARASTLIEFVLEQEISRVATIAVSHSDADHLRGVVGLIAAGVCKVNRILVNPDSSKGSEQWLSLMYELDERERRGEFRVELALLEGESIDFPDPDVAIAVVAPRKRLAGLGPGSTDRDGDAIVSNSVSAVVRVSYRGTGVVLLAGDLDEVGLKHLLETGQDLSARVLVFPHHGGHVSRPSSIERNAAFARELTLAVSPSLVMFSIGRGQHETPRAEIVLAVQNAAPTARISCTQLSENCAAETPTHTLTHLAPYVAAGRARRRCCAGTVRIPLDGAEIEPLALAHEEFIHVAAPTHLCRPTEL